MLIHQPLPDVGQPVVARAGKEAGFALLRPVTVEVSLHSLARARVGQLDPHLNPDTVGGEVVVEGVGLVEVPTFVVAQARYLLQSLRPTEREVHVLGRPQRLVVEVVEFGLREPVIEHADDPELHVVPADSASDTVDAAE